MSRSPTGSPLKLAGYFARRYPGRSLITVSCLLLAGLTEGLGIAAMLPLIHLVVDPGGASQTFIGRAVEGLFEGVGIEPTVGVLLALIVAALWLKSALTFFAMSQVGYASADVSRDLRLNLIRALMEAKWEYLTGERTGNFASALGSEVGKAADVYMQLCQMLAAVIQIAVYLGLAFLLSWWVTLAAIAVGVLTMTVLSRLVRIARRAGQAQTRIVRSLTSRLIDGLGMMKPLKAMGEERQLLPLLESDVEGLNEAQRRTVLSSQALQALQEPILVLAVALGLYLVLDMWRGEFEALFAVVLLFNRTGTRFNGLQRTYQAIARREPAFWFVHRLTRDVEDAREHGGTGREPSFRRHIRMDGVSFSYPDRPVLQDVSIEIPAGSFVAITGASGAGKTTLADLIIGLIRPSRGQIRIDGTPLEEISLSRWRRRIGYVPQDTYLFHDTVLVNVTLGDPSFERRDVEIALRRAGAWEFVAGLSTGIDTVVGERGLKISGGQRQRLSIARALLGNPELLILDEATTALDAHTEAGIVATLSRLAGEITILAISHQPAVVRAAHVVYEVRDGGVHPVSEGRGNPDRAVSGSGL